MFISKFQTVPRRAVFSAKFQHRTKSEVCCDEMVGLEANGRIVA